MAYTNITSVSTQVRMFDEITGEDYGVSRANKSNKQSYATIKNINFKGNIMDLFNYQAMICKSSNDIEAFGIILDNIDKHNRLILNQKEFADKHNIHRTRLNKILKLSVEVGFMIKIITNVYELNPYVFLSKGLSSGKSEAIEELQDKQEWLIFNQSEPM